MTNLIRRLFAPRDQKLNLDAPDMPKSSKQLTEKDLAAFRAKYGLTFTLPIPEPELDENGNPKRKLPEADITWQLR